MDCNIIFSKCVSDFKKPCVKEIETKKHKISYYPITPNTEDDIEGLFFTVCLKHLKKYVDLRPYIKVIDEFLEIALFKFGLNKLPYFGFVLNEELYNEFKGVITILDEV